VYRYSGAINIYNFSLQYLRGVPRLYLHKLLHTGSHRACSTAEWRFVYGYSVTCLQGITYRQPVLLHTTSCSIDTYFVTWYLRTSDPGFDSDEGKEFFPLQISRPTLEPTYFLIQWVPGGVSPRVRRLGLLAYHSPPSSAEVMPSWFAYWQFDCLPLTR
jgi:hypothetical protein